MPVSADSAASPAHTKFGLTLSGGGAKGFAHLGVLKVLEEVGMPIDYISGTSMGALVGGLYAMGYSTEYIEEVISAMNWNELFSDDQRRRHMPMEEKEWDSKYLLTLPLIEGGVGLPSGVVAGQRIQLLLNQLAWPHPGYQDFHAFPIPFTAVATNLETGEPLIMTEGYIAEAIRASISIPSIFNPVNMNGHLLIDGGVVRNLPVEEAREMGADYVLAVNVSPPLREAGELLSIIDVLDQTITFQVSDNINASKEQAD
ncbi:MAG: patatin-like phospholipase family protein, partial [Cyclonatronaceae bacterium]